MAINATQAFRIKTIVDKDGVIHLFGPFRAGESVEVIVLGAPIVAEEDRYPLHGTAYTFVEPFAGVAEDEWEAIQ
jgi:hypothetical protein